MISVLSWKQVRYQSWLLSSPGSLLFPLDLLFDGAEIRHFVRPDTAARSHLD